MIACNSTQTQSPNPTTIDKNKNRVSIGTTLKPQTLNPSDSKDTAPHK